MARRRWFESSETNVGTLYAKDRRLLGVRVAYQYGLATNRHRPAIYNKYIGRYDLTEVYADHKSAWFGCGLEYLRRVKCNAQRLGLQGGTFSGNPLPWLDRKPQLNIRPFRLKEMRKTTTCYGF